MNGSEKLTEKFCPVCQMKTYMEVRKQVYFCLKHQDYLQEPIEPDFTE